VNVVGHLVGGLILILLLTSLVVVVPLALVVATFLGSASAPAGHVPDEATVPMVGPVLGENASLDSLIAPWFGSRYVFGGNVIGGVDCSGFTKAIFARLGVNLPRTAQGQYNVAQKVSAPEPGDLVFFFGTYDSRPDFISHVGIYVGDGVMVSAVEPTLGRQNINSAWWRAHFVGFGRIGA